MPWQATTLIVDARCVETLSDLLLEAGALSVDVSDAAAGTPRVGDVVSIGRHRLVVERMVRRRIVRVRVVSAAVEAAE